MAIKNQCMDAVILMTTNAGLPLERACAKLFDFQKVFHSIMVKCDLFSFLLRRIEN